MVVSQRTVRAHAGMLLALIIGLLFALEAPAIAGSDGETSEPVRLEYFWAEGCPYCALQSAFLDELEERFGDQLEVARYEVSADPAARDRWVEQLAARGQEASGVPTTVMGDRVWVGFDTSVGTQIQATVETELAAREEAQPQPPGPEPPATDDGSIVVPLVGEIGLTGRSPIAATVLIAFVDGFNPCSLWVLTVLLAMVLNAGVTRARVALVGLTFLAVTGAIYGAFIAGAYTVLGLFDHLGAIRTVVAVVALVVGAINVKDYVAYKRGVSLTIPDRFKPRIYRGGRRVRDTERSLPAILGTTVALAAGIALVELPCTAGFPVIWTGILRSQEVAGPEFAGLLGLYLLVYVGLELALFAVALVTLSVSSFQERHGRLLKLVGGSVMLALGVVLLTAPELLDELSGAVLVVFGAVGAAAIVDLINRRRTARGEPGVPSDSRDRRKATDDEDRGSRAIR